MQISQTAIEQAIKTAVADASSTIVAAYLFGSHATGKVWAESDVDAALLFGEAESFTESGWKELQGIRCGYLLGRHEPCPLPRDKTFRRFGSCGR